LKTTIATSYIKALLLFLFAVICINVATDICERGLGLHTVQTVSRLHIVQL